LQVQNSRRSIGFPLLEGLQHFLHVDAKPKDLERYIYLIGLSDRNETMFYRAAMSGPARFIAILYDPTVADAASPSATSTAAR
jgi:malic enzyme